MPRFSLVIPCYNQGTYLGDCLESLARQTLAPHEIIIVDDGSTDDSLTVIQAIAAATPCVRVLVNQQNRGAIPTLQRGLDAARSPLVYFAAADDWVLPGFFQRATDELDANPHVGLFCSEAVLIDGPSRRPFGIRPITRPVPNAQAVGPDELRHLLRHSDNWILTGSSVFRRECVIRAGGFDETLGSFADGIMGRKIALTDGLFYCPQVFAVWAVFTDSYSRSTALNADRAQQALKTIPARLAGDRAFPGWYPGVFERRWRFAASRLALEATPPDRGLIEIMAARGKLDHVALRSLGHLPGRRLARFAILAWLWLRFRPTSLVRLLQTALRFRMQQFPRDANSTSQHAPLVPPSRHPPS
jgi:glycosyltransferase involved in cell wall biosynthesis